MIEDGLDQGANGIAEHGGAGQRPVWVSAGFPGQRLSDPDRVAVDQ